MKLVVLLGAMLSIACSSKKPGSTAYVTNNDLSRVSVHELDPSGQFLYVANTSSASVSAFRVAANGMLTAVAGSPFAAGAVPYDVKVSDSGNYAYVVNRDSEDVSVYAIDPPTGALRPIAGSPFAVGCTTPPCGPRALEFSPSGKFAFVPNRFSSTVTVFAVDPASGALSIVAGSPFPAGKDPRSAAAHPSGRYLYAANSGSNSISIYRVDSATGQLTAAGAVPTPGSPFSIALK